MKRKITIAIFLIIAAYTTKAQWTNGGPYGHLTIPALAASDNQVFAGTDEMGIFFSSDNGNSWSAVNSGLPSNSGHFPYVSALTISGSNIFACLLIFPGISTGIYASNDNGSNWLRADSGMPAKVRVLAFAVNGINIFAGTSTNGVYLSSDNGSSWSAVNTGFPANDSSIQALAVSGNSIFAGTSNDGVYLSSDNGNSWSAVNNGLPANIAVVALTVSGNNIFAATSNGVYLSSDNGNSWSPINNGLPANTIFRALAASGNDIFAITWSIPDGIYISSDNGNNWSAVNNGLPAGTIESLAANSTYVFVGIPGAFGVWQEPINSITTGIRKNELLGKAITIYPNPSTKDVKITLSENINGNFSLYNMYGQCLKIVSTTGLQTQIDLSDLMPAMYIICVEYNGSKEIVGRVTKVD